MKGLAISVPFPWELCLQRADWVEQIRMVVERRGKRGDGTATSVNDSARRQLCASEPSTNPMGGDSRTLLLWPSH